jgi:glucosylceramidase
MSDDDRDDQSKPFEVEAWLTRPDRSVLCAKQPGYLPIGSHAQNGEIIKVNAARRYQTIDGFGFSLTGGSADLICKLAPDVRKSLLRELFLTDREGIGITYLRVSIGASDLSSKTFSYDDLPTGETDPNLLRFELEAGDIALIPLVKEILSINSDVRIIATPWTAPPWMKSNRNFIGGSLKREHYQTYAQYLVIYLQKLRSQGIIINALTPQNEPLNTTDNPSMGMTAAEQAEFIGHYLGPALEAADLRHVALFCYDHNCDRPDYPTAVLADPKARPFITGVAWHLYAGDPRALSQVGKEYATLKTYLTEQYVSAGGEFGADLAWHVRNVLVGTIRNGAQAVLEWNLASDPDCEPHTVGGSPDSQGAITISASGIERNLAYYIIAHLSRFVRPGSTRIFSTAVKSLPNVAFETTDGQVVLLVLNDRKHTRSFSIQYKGWSVTANLDSGAAGTYVWDVGDMSRVA